ncbi:hypothetical protein Slin14017_G058560 [Septoria linicola]|nr:hypothetical protein Slin14017_G058560 [Septoria linicola]
MSIEILSGPQTGGIKEDHELFFARRALALLKCRLGTEGLTDLLANDTAQADMYWERVVQESNGQWTLCSVIMRATGVRAKDFLGWFQSNKDNTPMMVAAHPEHYVSTHGPILETVGEQVSFFNLNIQSELHPCVKNKDPEKYPIAFAGAGSMRSGTVMGHACHQFRDLDANEGDGLEVCFGGWMPAACGEDVIETHRKHLVVEWTNWLRQAQEELAVK